MRDGQVISPAPILLFAVVAAAIVALWGWLGAEVQMPPSPLSDGRKIPCISYAPFRGDEDPFGPDVPIDPRQISADLARLKEITSRLTGNFPGSPVNLRFFFGLDGDKIASLEIIP